MVTAVFKKGKYGVHHWNSKEDPPDFVTAGKRKAYTLINYVNLNCDLFLLLIFILNCG